MSHSTNKLRRGNLLCCFSENFWYRKNSWIREGEGRERVSRLYVKNFCLTVPKNFVKELFSVSLISGIEKVWDKRGARQF